MRKQLDAASEREAEARRAVGLLNAILDALPVGVTVQTEDGTVMLENGMAAASAERAGAGVPTSPALPAAGVEEEAAQPADAITMEERVVTGSGLASQRTFLIAHRPVRILDRPLLVSTAFDFTDRKKAELELSKRAYIDELTGLPNGALLAEQVRQVLASSEGRCRFALAFLDIDNFKHINDYYTHAIGDALLLKVAQRISAHIRPSDFAGRISGDEFLLVLYPLDSDEELETLINNLLKELKEPFLIDGYEILTSASIGVSVYPGPWPQLRGVASGGRHGDVPRQGSRQGRCGAVRFRHGPRDGDAHGPGAAAAARGARRALLLRVPAQGRHPHRGGCRC